MVGVCKEKGTCLPLPLAPRKNRRAPSPPSLSPPPHTLHHSPRAPLFQIYTPWVFSSSHPSSKTRRHTRSPSQGSKNNHTNRDSLPPARGTRTPPRGRHGPIGRGATPHGAAGRVSVRFSADLRARARSHSGACRVDSPLSSSSPKKACRKSAREQSVRGWCCESPARRAPVARRARPLPNGARAAVGMLATNPRREGGARASGGGARAAGGGRGRADPLRGGGGCLPSPPAHRPRPPTPPKNLTPPSSLLPRPKPNPNPNQTAPRPPPPSRPRRQPRWRSA